MVERWEGDARVFERNLRDVKDDYESRLASASRAPLHVAACRPQLSEGAEASAH